MTRITDIRGLWPDDTLQGAVSTVLPAGSKMAVTKRDKFFPALFVKLCASLHSSFREVALCRLRTLERGPIMTPVAATAQKLKQFDPKTFLSVINGGRKLVDFAKKQTIFRQGDPSDAVFYLQKGNVQLTVVSKFGKEGVIGILKEGDFFGESCLTGEPLRLCSATALTDCSVMRVEKKIMVQVLHEEHALTDVFVAYLLGRNIRYQADLVDHLFNSSEKRLARILLMLAHFGKEGTPDTVIPKISQETLADMVGTTRSRVNFFMNKFRKLGFINYDTGSSLQVHSSLLNVVLHD